MEHFHQFENAEFTLHFLRDDALRDVHSVLVTFAQGDDVRVQLDESQVAIDAESNEISLTLTQAQAGRFSVGKAWVQVNIVYADTLRKATCEREIEVRRNQHREVMP